jgi:ubiquinone biosynthesis protein
MLAPVRTAVFQDMRRLREISQVLIRHGFQAVVAGSGLNKYAPEEFEEIAGIEAASLVGDNPEDAALRFRHVLEELGPTFVKLGQVLSTRPDLCPPEFLQELRHLQDRVAPMSSDEVKATIEESLGPIDEHFSEFIEEPLAAASIGQVHLAKNRDGQTLVVKVQRRGIGATIRSDLDLLYTLAKLLEATIHEVELYTPTAIVKEFERAILAELDFTQEGRNVEEFSRNFESVSGVEVPKIYWELSNDRVLAMEYVDGIALSEVEPGSDEAKMILDELLAAMVKMVLDDGFFHGDPHPGNILIRDGKLHFIDFGLVGRLSAAQQDDVMLLIISVVTGDVEGISRTLLKMGRPVGRVNLRAFKADVVRIRDKYLLSNLSDIDVSAFIQDVMGAAQQHRIKLNPNYAVLVKTAATIEGIMRFLEPDLDIMAVGMPYAKEFARRRFSTRKIMQGVASSAMGLTGFLNQVPQHLDQILMDLEGGNLVITVANPGLDDVGKHLNTLGTRLFLGIIASGLAISGAVLLSRFDDVMVFGDVSVLLLLGVTCVLIAILFFWWALSWHIIGSGQSNKLRLAPLMKLLRRE